MRICHRPGARNLIAIASPLSASITARSSSTPATVLDAAVVADRGPG